MNTYEFGIQGTQLAYNNLVSSLESDAAVSGLQRLQDKTLLEYKPGHGATPDLIAPWLTEVRSLQTIEISQGGQPSESFSVRGLKSAIHPSTTCDTQLHLVAVWQTG